MPLQYYSSSVPDNTATRQPKMSHQAVLAVYGDKLSNNSRIVNNAITALVSHVLQHAVAMND